jgi:hypothetical protein
VERICHPQLFAIKNVRGSSFAKGRYCTKEKLTRNGYYMGVYGQIYNFSVLLLFKYH